MSVSGNEMNCEDYREAIAADPSASFEGAEHAAGCASCSTFRGEMQALDENIARALAIDVPELVMPELPPLANENREDDNVVNLPFRRAAAKIATRTPTWLGIAASLAFAVSISWQLSGDDVSGDQLLAEQVLAHLDYEPGALRVTDVAVSDAQFSRVVNSDIGTMDRNVGLVSYAQTCIINGQKVPHLVMQGEHGPITLILMPDESVSSPVSLSGESVNGVILPVGDGSIAIIGEREEEIRELEQRVVDSVEWRI